MQATTPSTICMPNELQTLLKSCSREEKDQLISTARERSFYEIYNFFGIKINDIGVQLPDVSTKKMYIMNLPKQVRLVRKNSSLERELDQLLQL